MSAATTWKPVHMHVTPFFTDMHVLGNHHLHF